MLNEDISMLCENRVKKRIISVEDDSLTSEQMHSLFGLTREQFEVLFSYIAQDIRNSSNRTSRNALATYLIKLRLNLPQEAIAILFGVASQPRVSETIKAVSDSIFARFTPHCLGFAHLTNMQIQQHQSKYLQAIFDLPEDSKIVIADGTYIYIERSSGVS